MTFWILGVLAGFLTFMAVKRHNFVFYAGASLGWWALWGYNLSNPPANITIGTFVYDILYYSLILMAIGVFLLYFRNRNQMSGTSANGETRESGNDSTVERGSLITMPPEEYRDRIRRAVRRGRR